MKCALILGHEAQDSVNISVSWFRMAMGVESQTAAGASCAMLVLALASSVGCSGDSCSQSQTTLGISAGTYAATITANSGNLSHNTALQVVVQ